MAGRSSRTNRGGRAQPDCSELTTDAQTQDRWSQRQISVHNSCAEWGPARVERSLYQRAVGYNYEAVKIFMPAGHNKPVYAPYIEHVPPDTTAAIFWLKNRDQQHWRDNQQLEHVMGKYIISDQPMTEEQWAKERADVLDVEPVLGGREGLHRDAASHGLPRTASTSRKWP
jgi:hypothetical protein